MRTIRVPRTRKLSFRRSQEQLNTPDPLRSQSALPDSPEPTKPSTPPSTRSPTFKTHNIKVPAARCPRLPSNALIEFAPALRRGALLRPFTRGTSDKAPALYGQMNGKHSVNVGRLVQSNLPHAGLGPTSCWQTTDSKSSGGFPEASILDDIQPDSCGGPTLVNRQPASG